MFIRTQPGGKSKVSQPTTVQIVSFAAGRNQTILTNLTAGTDFYIRFGLSVASPTNFDFIVKFGAPAVVVDNWTGPMTCNPTPTAGQLNVSELMGSTYQGT